MNHGAEAVKIAGILITGQHAGDFTKTEDSCSNSTLEPDGRCSIFVSFAPKAEGSRSAVMTIEHAAPGSPASIPLTGTGAATAP